MIDLSKKIKTKKYFYQNGTKKIRYLLKKNMVIVLLIILLCSMGFSIVHSIDPSDYGSVEHSHKGIDCASCHDPDSFDILTEDPNDLCITCHGPEGTNPIPENHGLGLPCSSCHSITSELETGDDGDDDTPEPTHPPVDADTDCSSCHDTTMTAHDTCVSCHNLDSETTLGFLNGTAVEDTSILCSQCHEDEYSEWLDGIHVNNHESKVCIDCHGPHDPYVVIETTLPPVSTMAGENEIPGPIIPPIIFFVAVIGALGYAVYTFVLRRG
jgi:predicted CXXCH cytochrome family protein